MNLDFIKDKDKLFKKVYLILLLNSLRRLNFLMVKSHNYLDLNKQI